MYINQVNADAATPHIIQFNIPGSGVQTISLTSALPALTQSNVTIDGYTQPAALAGTFSNRVINIQLVASLNVGFEWTIVASNILVRGFDFVGQVGEGYAWLSVGVRYGTANTFSNVKIQGNFFNVSPTGDAYLAPGTTNVGGGVQIYGNVSGGISSGTNVIIGVDGDGINDDKEGNLSAAPSNVNSGMYDIRDVDRITVAGNWEGLKPDGSTLVNYLSSGNSGHSNYDVYLGNCTNSIVGTNGDGVSDVLERNVFADGAVGAWVTYNNATGTNPSLSSEPLREPGNNIVTGNYIGTDVTGNSPTNRITYGIVLRGIGNYAGCNTAATTNNTFRNIISTITGGVGVYELPINTVWDSVSNTIIGNWIGIGANGTSALTGTYGIVNQHSVNTKIINNVIGNMASCGIYIGISSATGSTINNNGLIISNNYIGLLPDGISAAPIGTCGILINNGINFQIKNNIISNSTSNAGIAVRAGLNAGFTSQNITISQNSIYNNGGLGIDLWPKSGAGVTPNDGAESASSSNTDPNLFMDYPILTAASLRGNSLTVSGYVGSAAGQTLFAGSKVEFFAANNIPANQNGPVILGDGLSVAHGEGQTYLGTTYADANGNFTTTLNVVGTGINATTALTGTATDAAGNTSEFGPNFSNITLPLKLISFNAFYNENKIQLNWTTNDETNVVGYTIERSSDGNNFIPLNTIDVINNNALQNNYSSTDINLPANATILYYRLKINNTNGDYTFSNIIPVVINNANNGLQVYPNPTKNFININFQVSKSNMVSVSIIDAGGSTIKTYTIFALKGHNAMQFTDISTLPSGTYIIKLSEGSNNQSAKFIINK